MSKAEWKTVRLGDAATFINGCAFKPSDWCSEGLPIIRIQNLTESSKEINYYNGVYSKKYEINNGDILISWSASLGVYEWKKGKALLNQHIFKVEFDKLDFDKKYFMYLIKLKIDEMLKHIHGATMKHITKKDFDRIPISYCPLPTQRHIAATLDKANELIALRKKQLEELDALAEAVFYDMFGDPVKNEKGWEMVKLEQVCSKITDGEHATPKRVSEGILLLSARNILNHKINLLDVDYIDDDEYNRISKRIIPKENDILISCSGSIGRVCRVPKNLKFQMVRSVAILQLKDKINSIFIEYQLCTSFIQRQINRSINQSSQANLFQGKIKLLNILLPPFELQTRFATIIEKIEEQKAQVRQALQESEDLFQRLMQDLFHPH